MPSRWPSGNGPTTGSMLVNAPRAPSASRDTAIETGPAGVTKRIVSSPAARPRSAGATAVATVA